MKKTLTLAATLLTVTSCGEVKDLTQGFIDAPSAIVKDVLRIDEDDSVDINQENTLNNLESRVNALEKANELNNKLISINSASIGNNMDEIATIDGILVDLQVQIDDIENTLLDLEATNNSQDTQITFILSQLAGIETSIVLLEQASQSATKELIDPCGDKVGHFDEILIVFNSGEIVAYFEQSGKRMLSQLVDGNYQTTDKQKCKFSIVGGKYVE